MAKNFVDTIIGIVLLFWFFLLLYSKMKKQTMKESWEEIKELFEGKKEQVVERIGDVKPKFKL